MFFGLAEAEPGDGIVVTLADGAEAIFRVVETGQFARDAFPTEPVYGGPPDRPLLRLSHPSP